MPFDASSRLPATSTGEKVAKLSEFIARDMDTRAARGLQTAGGLYLLVARSPESPVAQALRAHAIGLTAMGIRTHAIFSEIEPAHAGTMPPPFAQPGECRVVRDQRLLAAHEQLVLAPDYAWIGDSMRREPSRRDTFERFAPASTEVAMQATRSFERLWRATVAIESVPAMPAAIASHLTGLAAEQLHPENPRRQ